MISPPFVAVEEIQLKDLLLLLLCLHHQNTRPERDNKRLCMCNARILNSLCVRYNMTRRSLLMMLLLPEQQQRGGQHQQQQQQTTLQQHFKKTESQTESFDYAAHSSSCKRSRVEIISSFHRLKQLFYANKSRQQWKFPIQILLLLLTHTILHRLFVTLKMQMSIFRSKIIIILAFLAWLL